MGRLCSLPECAWPLQASAHGYRYAQTHVHCSTMYTASHVRTPHGAHIGRAWLHGGGRPPKSSLGRRNNVSAPAVRCSRVRAVARIGGVRRWAAPRSTRIKYLHTHTHARTHDPPCTAHDHRLLAISHSTTSDLALQTCVHLPVQAHNSPQQQFQQLCATPGARTTHTDTR